MNQIIKIFTNKEGIRTVSAKDLHSFLGAGSDVHTWFSNQVEKCMLRTGLDFTQVSGKSTGGGWFHVKEVLYDKKSGGTGVTKQTMVTQVGLQGIIKGVNKIYSE